MKKYSKLIGYSIGALLCILTILGFSYAWYVNIKSGEEISGNSTGLKYTYTIDGDNRDTTTFKVSDITYFDITSEIEKDYFLDMSCMITFELVNVGKTSFTYDISKTLYKDNNIYIDAYFTTEKLASTPAGDFSTWFKNNTISSGETTLAAGGSITVYCYLIGVAAKDATNEQIYGRESRKITINIETNKIKN